MTSIIEKVLPFMIKYKFNLLHFDMKWHKTHMSSGKKDDFSRSILELIPNSSLLAISRTINPLFKVLFHLSLMVLVLLSVSCRYLALDEHLPPNLGCNPKQPDSENILV